MEMRRASCLMDYTTDKRECESSKDMQELNGNFIEQEQRLQYRKTTVIAEINNPLTAEETSHVCILEPALLRWLFYYMWYIGREWKGIMKLFFEDKTKKYPH